MKVEDIFRIKGRGNVLAATVDVEVKHKGATVCRLRDGASWKIRGVERFAKFLARETLFVGESVALLVPDDCDIAQGDAIAIVPAVEEAST